MSTEWLVKDCMDDWPAAILTQFDFDGRHG